MDEFLRRIGLEAHSEAFVAHGIDRGMLDQLTDADLRELGLNIGERKRFRAALASTRTGDADQPRTIAERRPLTVVFVDLVDSSSLGERLDPEDMFEVLRAYTELCSGAINRFGGQVARVVGDGILAYFCYPLANENDPERAVRAALDITASIGRLQTAAGVPLRVRIGVATGNVLISDLLAGGSDEKRSVTGSTANLAAKLQGLAPPDGIIVAEATHQRTGTLFACEELGAIPIKGFAEPQRVFQVLRAFTSRAPAERQVAARLTPLFGRDAELTALDQCWSRAERGEGGIVLVTGEPGIGKSRLVDSFIAGRQWHYARTIRLAASAFDGDSPLRPFIDWFHSAADLEAADSADLRLARLAAMLEGSADERARAQPILERLLGLRSEEDQVPRLRERILDVVAGQLLAIAERQPLCLVVEDLHWLDPTSRELLEVLAGRIGARRIMLIVTAREGPEANRVAGLPHAVSLRLGRLGAEDCAGMVRALFGGQRVPNYVTRLIARKTDGIPLFVEEFLRVVGRRFDVLDWNAISLDELGPVKIPASLHDALMARLDPSGPAKEVAQVAAVIGRRCRHDILAAAARLPASQLQESLNVLASLGVLADETVDGHRWLSFGHALVRDTAYDSILRDRKQELHARVAEALRRMDPEVVERQPELLALHLTEGGLAVEAVSFWLRAARRSIARSALIEASRLLQHGLAVAEGQPASPDLLERRVEIMTLLGPVLIALKGPGTAEVRALYEDAYMICQTQPEALSRFPIYWGRWRASPDSPTRHRLAAELLDRARGRSDSDLLLQAHHCNWASLFELGDLVGCCSHIDDGLAIYDSGDYREHATLYGNHDPKVCALGERAQALWMMGRLETARYDERRSLDWAAGIGHLGSRMHAMDMAMLHASFRRDHDELRRIATDLIEFTEELGLADHRSRGQIFLGWAISAAGDPAAGLAQLEPAIARQYEIATHEDFPMYVCMHAEALARHGKPERAIEELQRGRRQFELLGLKVWVPEVLRVYGETMLVADSGATEQALEAFQHAIVLATEQGASMLVLRATVSLARLHAQLGDPRTAWDELFAARRAIVESDLGVDLLEADELLAVLAAQLRPQSVPDVCRA